MEDGKVSVVLKCIFNAIKKAADNHMKENDLTMSQCMVLEYIRSALPDTVSQRDVERHFNLQHPTVSGILKRLDKNAFITTSVNSEDRRVKDIYLTDKAKQMFCEIRKHQQQIDAVILRGLDTQQIQTLHQLLLIVLKNVTGDQKDGRLPDKPEEKE
jgi:DNA-binding MarR family transcriptional regulator